ncbi:hypothetical protein PT974_11470 [Cladobotryum mycophilum]|uniref:Uncharacterized protein n=1 Tax=Cladobotryum mycophilum TaxID=491253 RepID=A0ABR0S5C8_9HYPO
MAGDSSTSQNLTIILATIIPSLILILIAAVVYHRIRRRKARFLNRGITPIDDEEIESWKVDRAKSVDEKSTSSPTSEPQHAHHPNSSIGSIQKPPSVIIYQNYAGGRRGSDDQSPWSPSSGKRSMDVPQTPVLARAPNSRPGLTDESIKGDEAFLTHVKRHPSRLAKPQPGSPRHARTRSTRSSFGGSASRELWYTQTPDQNSPRPSFDTFIKSSPSPRTGRRATVSTPTGIRHNSYDDDIILGGLSPRPLIHRSEIGRAIG